MRDDELADALDAQEQQADRERTASPEARRARLRTWIAGAAAGIVVIAGVGTAMWWPSRTDPAPAASSGNTAPSAGAQTDPGASPSASSAIDLGANLLTGEWPDRAIEAFTQSTAATDAARLLLTSTQVQAIVHTAADPATWHDVLYVEDVATDLGTTATDVSSYEPWSLTDLTAGAIAAVTAQAPGLVGIDAADETYVIVERDVLTDGSPLRISVYLISGADHHLVVADATGAVLSAR